MAHEGVKIYLETTEKRCNRCMAECRISQFWTWWCTE